MHPSHSQCTLHIVFSILGYFQPKSVYVNHNEYIPF